MKKLIYSILLFGSVSAFGAGATNTNMVAGFLFTDRMSKVGLIPYVNLAGTIVWTNPANLVTAAGVSNKGPYITVSSRGIANGLSATFNDGMQFGPDTVGTTTYGIQEAIDFLPVATGYDTPVTGGGRIQLTSGRFICSGQLMIPNTYPFNLTLEGAGKISTLVEYTGTASNFIDTVRALSDTSLSAWSSLNLNMRDIAFSYRNDTNLAYLVNLDWVNEGLIENCLFTVSQAISYTNNTGYRLGSSLVYIEGVPTNRVGIVGFRTQGILNNMLVFRNCAFYGLACGLITSQDHTRVEDSIFANIGHYFTNGPTGGHNIGTAYTTNTSATYTNIFAAGPCIVADGGLFEFHVLHCQFFQSAVEVITYSSTDEGPANFDVISPNDESVEINWLTGNNGSGDVNTYWRGQNLPPIIGTINVNTGVINTNTKPSNFKWFDTGRLGFKHLVGTNVAFNLTSQGTAQFTSLSNALSEVRVIGAIGDGTLVVTGIPTNGMHPFKTNLTGDSPNKDLYYTGGGFGIGAHPPTNSNGSRQGFVGITYEPEGNQPHIILRSTTESSPAFILFDTHFYTSNKWFAGAFADKEFRIGQTADDTNFLYGNYITIRTNGEVQITNLYSLITNIVVARPDGTVAATNTIYADLTIKGILNVENVLFAKGGASFGNAGQATVGSDGNALVNALLSGTHVRARTDFQLASNSLANWPTSPSQIGGFAIVNSNGYPYILLSTNGTTGSATWTGTNKLGW